jgi:pimeloyl-ACP methyl ester carboxylesterase
VKLMRDCLGYDRFGAYGGDWGAIVTSELGHAHAQHLTGVYMSLPVIPGVNRRELAPEAFGPDEEWMVQRTAEVDWLIRSHVTVHTHDPQTLAYALADSPVGTAAWIWERRRAWSDCDGDVESVFNRDELITLASIYWLTGAIGPSLRIYFEHFNGGWPPIHDRIPIVEAPTGFAIFPKELVLLPRSVAAKYSNLHRWTLMPKGGHFGPAEQPLAVAAELTAFFGSL